MISLAGLIMVVTLGELGMGLGTGLAGGFRGVPQYTIRVTFAVVKTFVLEIAKKDAPC
jgi:hypothetical protein